MANRYWIGGTGNWSDTNHWSASSGGSGGASVPTSADNAYFDANSFSGSGQTVTINAAASCLDMDWTGASNSPTLAGSSALNVYGSFKLISGMTVTFSGGISFRATSTGKTITSAGKGIGTLTFNGSGGEWTLQDDLSLGSSEIGLSNGTLRTNGKNVTCSSFYCTTNSPSLYLGTSIITISNSWMGTGYYPATFSAGTSTIRMNGGNGFAGRGLTYNIVEIINDVLVYSNATISELKLTAGKTITFEAGSTQTITTLSGDGASGSLITILSDTPGSAFTLSKSSGTVQCAYYSIKDCTATGGARWAASTSTNVSGNTGWLFGVYVDIAESHLTALQEYPMAVGMGYAFGPAYDTCQGVDVMALTATINAGDTGHGADTIGAILAIINANDSAHGLDILSAAKAFFFIDPDNILQPIGAAVIRGGKEELLPKTRDNTEEVPGRHGEIDFGSELQPRLMEIKVHVGATPEERSALKRQIAAYLNPMNGAKPLIDSKDPERTYYVKYAGNIDLTNYATAMTFTIPFKASDPIIYGSFEQSQVGSGTLINDGNIECPIKITISGAVTNPSMTIGAVTLTYTGTLTAVDTLIIDTGALTCTLNGLNAIGNLSGLTSVIKIQPGNTAVTAASAGATVFTWSEQWI